MNYEVRIMNCGRRVGNDKVIYWVECREGRAQTGFNGL